MYIYKWKIIGLYFTRKYYFSVSTLKFHVTISLSFFIIIINKQFLSEIYTKFVSV